MGNTGNLTIPWGGEIRLGLSKVQPPHLRDCFGFGLSTEEDTDLPKVTQLVPTKHIILKFLLLAEGLRAQTQSVAEEDGLEVMISLLRLQIVATIPDSYALRVAPRACHAR